MKSSWQQQTRKTQASQQYLNLQMQNNTEESYKKLKEENKLLKEQIFSNRIQLAKWAQKISQQYVQLNEKDLKIQQLQKKLLKHESLEMQQSLTIHKLQQEIVKDEQKISVIKHKLDEERHEVSNLCQILQIQRLKAEKYCAQSQQLKKQEDQVISQNQQFKQEILNLQYKIQILQMQIQQQRSRQSFAGLYKSPHSNVLTNKNTKSVRSTRSTDSGNNSCIQKMLNINQIKHYLTQCFDSEQQFTKWYHKHTNQQIQYRKQYNNAQFSTEGFSLDHSLFNINVKDFVKCNWENLEFLKLDHLKIGNKGWEMIVDNSNHFLSLKVLSLHRNKLTQIKQSSLQKFPTLKYLDLSIYFSIIFTADNPLDQKSIQYLKRYKKYHPNCIVSLTIDGRSQELS